MNNMLFSEFLEVNKKEKKYNKILLIISFLIGIIGLVIIMRLVEVSLPNKNSILVDKNEIKKIDNKNRGMLLELTLLQVTIFFLKSLIVFPMTSILG